MKGILLIDKPKGATAFSLIRRLRRITGVKKIGHAGTLDPFATGVMVLLVGRDYTRRSDQLLTQDKEYIARLHLGATSLTYDPEGPITSHSTDIPSLATIEETIEQFQGTQLQIPPMHSAKKVNGKKLYELARAGKTIERKPSQVTISIDLLTYDYPHLDLRVKCSKGTYIRSLAHDIGQVLKTGAYLSELRRSRSGQFTIDQCIDGSKLETLELASCLTP